LSIKQRSDKKTVSGWTLNNLNRIKSDSSNLRRANFVIMRRTYRTLNDCEMQHNAEVGLFTKPSKVPSY